MNYQLEYRYSFYLAGFSLIELMIAMVLGIILLLGVTTVVVNSSQSYRELARTSQQLENGRFAIEVFSEDLRHAGYYGLYSPPSWTAPASLPNPCGTPSNSNLSDLSLVVQGYDSMTQPICVNHVEPDTDILAIRRTSTLVTPLGSLGNDTNKSTYFLQSTPSQVAISLGSDADDKFKLTRNILTPPSTLTSVPADARQLHVHIYFIRSFSTTLGDDIPTLCRWTLKGVECLVEGIENFQIDYGIDTNGDGIPNNYIKASDINLADWRNVVTVHVHLLARNLEETRGYKDQKVYRLGLATEKDPLGPFNDAFKRRVFSSMIRLTNVSARREVPQ